MLVKYFDGIGLSTPRNQVPALTSSPYPTIAAARAPALAPPTLTTRTTKTRRRGLQKNANIFAVAPYRVEKAGSPLQATPFRRVQEIRPKPQAKS
jgi:hypothetical protein